MGYRQKHADTTRYYSEDQIRRVILASGIDIVYEIDSEFIIFCPFHNNTRSPAGEINKSTGSFYCFSCQEVKDLVEIVMQASSRTYFEAVRLIDSKENSQDLLENLTNALNKKEELKEFDLEIIDRLNKNALSSARAAEYLKGRGIEKNSVIKYHIGYSESQDMITIPVYSPDGMCLGFVARSIEGKVFKNTPGLAKSKTFFNIHRAKRYDRVFVVESSFDAIRLEQAGVHAVATLGASVSKQQRSLLKQYFNQIVVLPDNDDAGNIMANKLLSDFGTGCVVSKLPEGKKDVSDMPQEELKKFLDKFDDIVLSVLK